MYETLVVFFVLVRNRKSEGKQSVNLKVSKKPFQTIFVIFSNVISVNYV